MLRQAVEVRPTIDRPWLERMASDEPLVHAYALWDLDRTPQDVRFASAVRGEETVGYLLIWLGRRDRPVVHWFGAPDVAGALIGAFPSPPFVAVVPLDVAPLVQAAFPSGRSSSLKMMLRASGPMEPEKVRAGRAEPPRTVRRVGEPSKGTDPAWGRAGPVRPLRRADRGQLAEFVRRHVEPDLGAYLGLDPETEPAWGAFDSDRLVGVARAAARLPRVWVVGGVFVEPTVRGRGLGRALVTAVVEAAEGSGARVGLYVRNDTNPALGLYEALGFREVGRRAWIDVDPSEALRGWKPGGSGVGLER